MHGDTGVLTATQLISRLRPVKREDTGRLGRFTAALLVVASFGPYVVGGLRTEQLAFYGLLGTIGFVRLAWLAVPRLPSRALLLLVYWITYLAIAVIVSIGPPPPARWLPGSLLAGVDNLAGPIAVLLVVWSTVSTAGAQRTLELAAKLTAWLMAANGVLAVVMTRVDLSAVLRPFWASSGADGTVAANAAGLGRYCGVFNQPAEAGLAYGLAGLCAWYVWRDKPKRMYLLLIPIVLGGLISVSKIFILGGLPLILWLVWRNRKTGARISLLFITAGLVLGLAQSGFADQWSGLQYLTRLLSPPDNGSALGFLTAGRLGSGSSLAGVFSEVHRVSPWWGFGAPGLQVAYDNGWTEAYVVAGVAGLVLYTLILLVLWRIGRADPDRERRTLVTCVAILAAGGSLGVPALTANRASTLLWLIVALAVVAAAADAVRSDRQPLGAVADQARGLPLRQADRRRPVDRLGRAEAVDGDRAGPGVLDGDDPPGARVTGGRRVD
jgi:hypothetical protein